jgi:hypothetical protein
MKRTKRIWALILALLATLCLLPGAAMAEGEYCYWHKDSSQRSGYYTYYQRSIHRSLDMSSAFGEGGGSNILPAVYLLYEGESKDNPTKVYCCDAATSVLPNEEAEIRYRRLTLENAGYYSADNAKMIRAIAKNSYPFVTKDEMVETLNKKISRSPPTLQKTSSLQPYRMLYGTLQIKEITSLQTLIPGHGIIITKVIPHIMMRGAINTANTQHCSRSIL